MRRIRPSLPGFTIVELLIVIVVISILASITVTAFSGVSERTKISRANTEMRSLAQLIKIAVTVQNKPLYQITGSTWTLANCYYDSNQPYIPMRQLASTDACWTDYQTAINNIAIAAGSPQSASKFLKGDPWGSPYLIDENELTDNTDPCAKDTLRSAGSKGIPFVDTEILYPMGYSIANGKDNSNNPCP
jgi:prepilin-type N-terminal cleavage/methylation domain-containing protein